MRWSNHLAQLCVCASALLVPFVAQAALADDPGGKRSTPDLQVQRRTGHSCVSSAQGYQYVTPQFVEDGIHNFFQNIGDVAQISQRPAASRLQPVPIRHASIFNTTSACWASPMSALAMGLHRNDEDFGQTLVIGAWAVVLM